VRVRRRVDLKPLCEFWSEGLSEDLKHARQRAARDLLPVLARPMTTDDFKAIGKGLVAHLSLIELTLQTEK